MNNFKIKFFIGFMIVGLIGGLSVTNIFAKDQKTIIKYWRHMHTPAEILEKGLIKNFEKQHPDIQVKMTTVLDPDLPEKLMIAFAGGGGPDLFNLSNGYFPQYVFYHLVTPIDLDVFGVKTYEQLAKQYPDEVLEAWKSGDKYYGLATETSCYATAINTKHFREAGLDPDKDYPRTWVEGEHSLVKIGQKLVRIKKGEIIRRGYSIPTDPGVIGIVFVGMLRQLGGSVVSPVDKKVSTVNSKAGIKALQTLYDFIYKYKIATVPSGHGTQGFGFETGDTSIVTDVGPWERDYLKEEAPTIYPYLKFTPWPRFKGGKDIGCPTYGYALQVSSNSKHKKEAWELAKILVSTPEDRRKIGLFVPDEWPWPQEIYTGGFITLDRPIAGILFEAISKTLCDKVAPDETLDIAKKKIDEYLSKRPY